MKIIVLSCDKNQDTFEPFHHCMEKYYPNHPEVVYYTESVKNPYYRTISVPHELDTWTRGLREFLSRLDDDKCLLMVDDCFIRRQVDEERIKEAAGLIRGKIALLNFEQSWDEADELTEHPGWKRRKHGSSYEVSIMCGIWDKTKLMQVIERDSDPWTVEEEQNNCGFDYYINCGGQIIDWGYQTFKPAGIFKGKWCHEIVPFFEAEGIKVDYSTRGFSKIF